ncbi:SRPBCC family protein [Geomonas nitrogeniifigens]|uniref:SRPBCC family protein n=1 Tax=Geomonas diazotrophica TaxID=2843197 RepID=A0ABX8JLK1_9BACT|nr:SRPBCC family protein [Geomonas nitrogeniifigens]QWV97509.1 SRPBCC family protein [Geomonas nitrogeniifigens]
MEPSETERSQSRKWRRETRVNVGPAERKASVIGGAALAVSGLRCISKRNYASGLAMMLAGGMFLYRGQTGHCGIYDAMGMDTVHTRNSALTIEKAVTIGLPPQEVYEFWRNLENLPRFMKHLESVQVTGARTSHWRAIGPGGIRAEWDAEMMEDTPGQQISWHSVGEADVPNKGSVEFKEAPGHRGTEVKVTIDYYPPGGGAGRAAAKLARGINAQQLEEDLKRLKQILEVGEETTARRTVE